MKVSLNLAQEFSNVDLKAIPRDELLQRIGVQLGAVEEVFDWGSKLEGAVVVRVVSCEKHPDADKLNVCQVDDGSGETTQVVCGAPNVRAGMYAVWLKPGVTVPSSRETDPFVLEAREIRGVVSNGMMASAHELGISDNHDGILEIDPNQVGHEPTPGEPITNYFGLDDFVVNCENKMFTHRPDCFGNLGVARELAGISGLGFVSPDWYLETPQFENVESSRLDVSNEISDIVPRFMAVVLKDISVKPSPVWMQAFLTRVGIKPINNVVDVTNYVMHLTGQPLHAFDYDKLLELSNSPTLMPRISVAGEKLTLLGKKEIELTGNEIVIATDKQAVALAGVMGGADTEVDETTKNIVIECATFDMYSIRRTSMRFGLFTDAVTRYNKGQSPVQNDRVLVFAIQEMSKHCGANQASSVYDEGRYDNPSTTIELPISFVNDRLGSSMNGPEMSQLLNNVEFEAETDDVNLIVKAPFWRMDIKLPEDIVEEIGRLYGYNLLPVNLPSRTASPASKNKLMEFKQELRKRLLRAGANEVLTYSFVHGDLLRKTGTDPDTSAYHLRNAISPDLQYYRTSLIPSLLSKVHPNIKAQAGSDLNQFAIFEIGKAHVKGHEVDGLPKQMERLALVVAADDKTANNKQAGAAYYLAKKYLDYLTNGQLKYSELDNDTYPITSVYQKGRSAKVMIDDQILGVIGEFKPTATKSLKLPSFCAGFELDLELLNGFLKAKSYQPLPNFPVIQQDITLETDKSYSEVNDQLIEKLKVASEHNGYKWQIEPLNIFKKDTEQKRITFRLTFSHPSRTLLTEEINKVIETIVKNESNN